MGDVDDQRSLGTGALLSLTWVVAVAISGCASSKLVQATGEFAVYARSATKETAATAGIVGRLCRQRAQLEFLAARVAQPSQFDDFIGFYGTKAFSLGLPGAPAITWKQHCAGYRLADRAFATAIASLAAYMGALGAFANDDVVFDEDIQQLAAAAATGTAALSAAAKPYKDSLGGVGKPLGIVANAVKGHWKAKHLGRLVDGTDASVQEVIGKLLAFIDVLRKRQFRDVHEALVVLQMELNGSLRVVGEHHIDLVSATLIDVMAADQLAGVDRQLTALADILRSLGRGHALLRNGWARGDDAGAETVKEIRRLGTSVDEAIYQFRNPDIEESHDSR